MDFVIDLLLEIYMELMFLIIPEDKRKKRHVVIVKILAVVITIGILVLAVWGIAWIVDDKNAWGWLPLSVAIVLSLVQIVFGVIVTIRRNRK